MRELYEQDPKFKEYVDKYCTKHEISPEIAFGHAVVKTIAEYYMAQNRAK